ARLGKFQPDSAISEASDLTPFAFVIHPLHARDVARKYPIARLLPDAAIEAFLRRKSAMEVSRITGIRSLTGETTEGWFVGCPLTARQLAGGIPTEAAYEKVLEAVELGAKLGAKVVGLGAFTAVVGDAGVTIARRASVAVTTGNSYTVATAIEGTLKACRLVGFEPAGATLAVVGATGSIGKTCAQVLGSEFGRTVLVGRDLDRTREVAATIPGSVATVGLDLLKDADAIVSVTSSDTAIIEPRHLKTGAIVCDVARPRDVSVRVAKERRDVLVIEGGVVSVPGDVDFGFNFGFPPKTAYACMAETMLLALEHRSEAYTTGKDVSEHQVRETLGWASKHGFKLAGFRTFERAVDADTINRVRAARGIEPAPVGPMAASLGLEPGP
ncbi:MAG: hypothetical protein SNJ61_12945, partial [Fimbriimonadaceae bacterium]